MNIFNAWPYTLIIELVGGLIFLWVFFRFVGKFTGETSFVRRNMWKLALVGFIIIAFISINTVMFRLESVKDEEAAQAMIDFSESKRNIEILSIEQSKSGLFTYETDPKTIHFFVQDIVTKEIAPCYIARDKVFVYVNDSVENPFIIFNSTENTIDLHFPGDSKEVHVEQIVKEEFHLSQLESENLELFLSSIDIIEE